MIRSCPDCTLELQPLFVSAPGHVELELDRCRECSGIFFDVGELEKAAGRQFPVRLEGGKSKRPCPNCKSTMKHVLLDGEVTIDECARCHGAFLDSEDLFGTVGRLQPAPKKPMPRSDPQAARPTPPVARKPKPKPGAAGPIPQAPREARTKVRVDGFVCLKCKLRYPFKEGNASGGGLVCRGCVVNPQVGKLPSRHGHRHPSHRDHDSASELIELGIETFFGRWF